MGVGSVSNVFAGSFGVFLEIGIVKSKKEGIGWGCRVVGYGFGPGIKELRKGLGREELG